MASTYQEKKTLDPNANQASDVSTSLAKSISTGSAAGSAAKTTTTGATSKYGQQINEAANSGIAEYDPNSIDGYTQAKGYLDNIIANKPGSYRSRYTGQLDDLYGQLMGRGQYQYNMNSDALYNNYSQRYMAAGQMAMRDKQANVAANTGGFGSSYAQTAGQGAYNEYVQKLNDVVPELQAQGLARYNAETDRMTAQYNLANTADQRDYGRYRDQMADYQNERAYAADRENSLYNRGYAQYQNAQNIGTTIAGWERDDTSTDKQIARSEVMNWINAGVKPSRAQIEAAGMDYDQVMAYYKKVK